MITKAPPRKSVDLPPRGTRNADPITDTPGAHPLETGAGAALGGALSGLAVGAVTGPVGAVAGAVLGAVAGGYAGKGIGELIDPTTEDNWLRDTFADRPYVREGEAFDDYEGVYRFGGMSEGRYAGRSFDQVEADLRREYELSGTNEMMPWGAAKPAVADGFNRSCQLRADRQMAVNRPA
jgi:hypothetical protein